MTTMQLLENKAVGASATDLNPEHRPKPITTNPTRTDHDETSVIERDSELYGRVVRRLHHGGPSVPLDDVLDRLNERTE